MDIKRIEEMAGTAGRIVGTGIRQPINYYIDFQGFCLCLILLAIITNSLFFKIRDLDGLMLCIMLTVAGLYILAAVFFMLVEYIELRSFNK